MDKAIEVSNLRKKYGDLIAVDGISFHIEQGKLFSFLGPNGAGKSTTIDILCTLMDFDEGDITINGFNLRNEGQSIRETIGVVYQDNILDSLLTVRENLTYRAKFYTTDKTKIADAVNEAISITGLTEFIDRPYGKLSGGQRRRADVARALINKPEILFLDEPTTGLDPQTRKSIWNNIKQLQQKTGMTVFLTTHYMEEAADSDHIIIIDHGKIVAEGTPTELKTRYATDRLRLSAADMNELKRILNETQVDFTMISDELIIDLPDTMAAIPIIEKCKDHLNNFQVLQGTMDDVFITITGKELRE